jgi:hypothetical protein
MVAIGAVFLVERYVRTTVPQGTVDGPRRRKAVAS